MPEIPSNNNNGSHSLTSGSGSTSKPLLSETLSMPLLPNYFSVENNGTLVMENGTESLGKNENSLEEQVQVEIGSGDEERLLPTDLLNDPDDECINENQTIQKPALRKTWSWTPLKGKITQSAQRTLNKIEYICNKNFV